MVLVNFWATWCGPCRVEIPDLIALQQKYPDQLVVLGISEDEGDIPLVKKFAAERNINYPLIMATPEIRRLFPDVMALPTTFVLDRDGKLVQKTVGLLNAKETEAGTRILAGLQANAEIVRVEPDKALGVDNVAQVKDVPGIDLATVPPDKRTEVLLALNAEACTCGCGLTVARCRIDDPTLYRQPADRENDCREIRVRETVDLTTIAAEFAELAELLIALCVFCEFCGNRSDQNVASALNGDAVPPCI